MSTYSVVLSGKVLDGFDMRVVVEQLAKLVQRDEASVARLLGGRRVVVRSSIDRDTCLRYLSRLQAIGVDCSAESDALDFDPQISPHKESAADARTRPESISRASTQVTGVALWNPEAAAMWSLLFTPLFGAVLHWLNWRALGNARKATTASGWVVGIAIVLLASLVALPNAASGVLTLVLLVWYFSAARPQARYVKEALGGTYTRRGWSKPLALGIVGILCFVAALSMPVADVAKHMNQLPSLGFATSTPECASDQVKGMIPQIAGDAIAGALGNTSEARAKVKAIQTQMPIGILDIRTQRKDSDIRLVTCAATAVLPIPKNTPKDLLTLIEMQAGSSEVLRREGDMFKSSITYTAQITDNRDQLYVTVEGLKPLIGLMALLSK